jgi:hypothetical protein
MRHWAKVSNEPEVTDAAFYEDRRFSSGHQKPLNIRPVLAEGRDTVVFIEFGYHVLAAGKQVLACEFDGRKKSEMRAFPCRTLGPVL